MNLAFGMRDIPDDITTAWGARWIWPADLVHNRQDMTGDETSRRQLEQWLNGHALTAARDCARRLARDWELTPRDDREVVLYEDEDGIIKANPQASHGYLYVAAWMKPTCPSCHLAVGTDGREATLCEHCGADLCR